ncbi:archaeosortase/exosortase family protein [Coraliomargarita sp. SDUM461003]|uniref:Archaeosortase/exosortase family protein n=1 Tax=Thalassobacterium maritimum TaxID=3041265 RepID=A0ABU1AYI3_9BACT|nr:archaeosortase/exosortase family protein [Coraliomargarita sp. SDUM461003]MDQ8209202.1 archaeosortase/exosortase family protein [Coraliomargarita sp. SDUM461003]
MPIRQQLASSFTEKYRQPSFWLHVLLFGLLTAALWPLTTWFAQTANDQSRIFNALIVLVAASVLLVRFGGVTVTQPLELNASARRALYAAYGLLLATYLIPLIVKVEWTGLLIIPAYCCALAAMVRFVFGADTQRLSRTVAGTLCAFLLLSILMEPLDWPLRSMAGQWSGYVLGLFGQSTDLGLVGQEGGPPMLILRVNDYPFHVASECNGFGVILTSLLLALLLAIYRRLNVFDLCLNMLAGVIIGFIFNTLRIVIIVILAPSLMEHYHLMHEIVGGLTYWACLILVWVSLNGPTRPEASEKA